MPCATHSRLWCGFDAVSSRLPSPFPSLLISVARLPLLSLVSRYVISILLLFCCHRQYCFSISSLRPSSLSGPSPCILPAGAYWLPMPLGLHWASSSARFSYCWRKVRDSNPRCVLPHATLAVWCFQPAQPTFQNFIVVLIF